MSLVFSNARQPGEAFANYRKRLRQLQRGVELYQRSGQQAVLAKSGERYTPGPHQTHKPHDVVEKVLDKRTGELVNLIVRHPGTLIKVKA